LIFDSRPTTTSHHAINYVVQSAIPIQDVRDIEKKQNGMGIGSDGDPSYTLDSMGTQGVAQDVGAFKLGQGAAARSIGYSETLSPTLMSSAGGNSVPAVHTNMIVRRLTPVECERLQGFPDGYTDIRWYKSKAGCFREELGKYGCPEEQNAVLETATDGARFKALGNSMAVPVIKWLGEQITKASAVIRESNDG
jgi:DNA (cytosine-5)-methyltransferase 1